MKKMRAMIKCRWEVESSTESASSSLKFYSEFLTEQ